MAASGLIASGVTSADYRHWCGESPRQTRLKGQANTASRDRLAGLHTEMAGGSLHSAPQPSPGRRA
jgi:hypothetical protein